MISRFRAIRQVLWITLALNLLSTVIKAGIGLWTGSLSLLASGLDALFDASSNVVGLVGIQVAARPPDAEHPYGHHKSETLAAMIIAGVLFVTVVGIVQQAVERLLGGSVPEVSAYSFGAIAVGLAIELFTSSYERRKGRELESDFLLADARHTRAHVYISLGVIVGLAAVWLGFPAADPLLALVIAGVIAKIGWDIVRSTADTLLDRAAVNPEEVRRLTLSVAGVASADRVRSRGPRGSVLVDLHIHVDAETPVDRAHEIADGVESLLMAQIPGVRDVVVHVEPEWPGATAVESLPERVRDIARHLAASVHEVRVQEVDGGPVVDLHLEVDPAWSLEEGHRLASQLEQRIAEALPAGARVYVHIEPTPQEADAGLFESERKRVVAEAEAAAAEIEEVERFHKIAVRRAAERTFVSLNCVLRENLPVREAHELASDLERRLTDRIEGVDRVLLHMEPPKHADP